MWQECIERYSEPGQLVLDPMAGIGTTLVAALMGRDVVVNELEHHFLLVASRNWAKMRERPTFGGLGQVRISWGDARNLDTWKPSPYQNLAMLYPHDDWRVLKTRRRKYGLPLADARALPLPRADAVVTSPPYEGSMDGHKDGIAWEKVGRQNGPNGQGKVSQGYTLPDAIITSPPYESHHQGGPDGHPERQDGGEGGRITRRYTDCVITSPPFGEAEKRDRSPVQDGSVSDVMTRSYRSGVHGAENIGNLRSDAYWTAMQAVYAECWRVLRPGGTLCLVLKGFTRDGAYVDLPAQTRELVEGLGFVHRETWLRELWTLSFWRILQQRRDPEAWDERLRYETVQAYTKVFP